MSSANHVIIAGAGIAGLTAALALARNGFNVTIFERAEKLEPIGAGIQLSPNATRILSALGLSERLKSAIVQPESICVMDSPSGREIVRIPLNHAEQRYGAPFWILHRADLQDALVDAAAATSNITVRLGTKVDDIACDAKGVSVFDKSGQVVERGIALIGADGIWSSVARHLRRPDVPRFAHRTAWRALVPAENVAANFRTHLVHLWVGPNAHLVHYPVKGGSHINIVGIIRDEWNGTGWSAAGERADILRHFTLPSWPEKIRAFISIPDRWQKWALYERKEAFRGNLAPVTLIGDAAHPILPFLALGAGMAIEDAAVLADSLFRYSDEPAYALRRYEDIRQPRTEKVQRASAWQGLIYSLGRPQALIRNMGMRILSGERLLRRYDWIYDWQPPEFAGG